jgi:hypothetical protein
MMMLPRDERQPKMTVGTTHGVDRRRRRKAAKTSNESLVGSPILFVYAPRSPTAPSSLPSHARKVTDASLSMISADISKKVAEETWIPSLGNAPRLEHMGNAWQAGDVGSSALT